MIVVTGAAGFIGRQVIRQLRIRGETVRAVIRNPSYAYIAESTGAEIVYGNICDSETMLSALKGADRLVHLAAILREKRGSTYQATNIDAVKNVYSAASKTGVEKTVQISVIGADAESSDPYFISRAAGECYAMTSGIPTSVLRFSAVFGVGDEFTNVMAALVRLGPLVPVPGNGQSRFQPIHVNDVARTIVHAVTSDMSSSNPLELGGPDILSYSQILDEIGLILGRRMLKLHLPSKLLVGAAGLLDTMLEHSPVTPNQLRMLRQDNVVSGCLGPIFKEKFGFLPRPLHGNIDYLRKIHAKEAFQILFGRMPPYIRDH